ncbi:TrlF family AAA-like ATPase [Maridesulfovibrio sp.]|uniref:TrlF family AAA-like ATPase n=1 Tax=Maridesulfovibrio sp. TaxID=2795000 RepID=UPI0029F5AE88|nr:hypothetical protein [Maridesulfovibrio sp.]
MNSYSGSRWLKFDFHAHTPESKCYGRNHKDEKFLKTYPLQNWLLDYMKAEIDCVAVTDHNCGNAIDYLKIEYNKLKDSNHPDFRPLTIFPGVEITAAGNIHILGIFPTETTTAEINSIVDNCRYNGTKGKSDDCTKDTPSEVASQISEKEGIAIPAHVDNIRGIFHEQQGIALNEILSNNSIFAMESSGICLPPQTYRDKKLDWAVVTGSDQHHPNGDETQKFPGSHFSWVKMEQPTWDELHQALLAHETCILDQTYNNPNQHPDIFIKSVKIHEMSHCGRHPSQDLKITFNPFFNAIIGGRGSGKSTILESIRIASRRDFELTQMGMEKIAQDLNEFMESSATKGVMTDKTSLTLEIFRRNKLYRTTWTPSAQTSLEEFNGIDWNQCDIEGNFLERFPIEIYSQKQIYTLASNPKGLLDIIDRSPSVNRTEWQLKWNAIKSKFLQLREKERSLIQQLQNEPPVKARLSDINNDMKNYEEQGHGTILTNYQYKKRQIDSISLEDNFNTLADKLKSAIDETRYLVAPEDVFNLNDPYKNEIIEIQNSTASELTNIVQALTSIQEKVRTLTSKRKSALENSVWYASVQQANAEYTALLNEYQKKERNLNAYNEWVNQRQQCERELKNFSVKRQELNETQSEINQVFTELRTKRVELYNKRNNFLSQTLGENPYVKMELINFGDISELEKDYRSILNLPNNGYEPSILEVESQQGILWELSNWTNVDSSGTNIFPELEKIKTETIEMINTGKKPESKQYIHGRFPNTLQTKFKEAPACIDKLLAWFPEDHLKVSHSNPGKKDFKDLAKGSAGQKAASILAFLLSYGDTPLIIDQPEDDLDSELIYKLIVAQIQENKKRRQIILVTHNANIVVNGDAELVHVLNFSGGQIRNNAKGGLGQKQIRDKICEIMEGGKRAFKKRYKRIILKG